MFKKETLNQTEIKKKFEGKSYLYSQVRHCFFENSSKFPPTISILCALKCAEMEGGLVYACTPERKIYNEIYCLTNIKLEAVYAVSRYKILRKEGLKLGWEGGILNDSRFS